MSTMMTGRKKRETTKATFVRQWRSLEVGARGIEYDRAVLLREGRVKIGEERLTELLVSACDVARGHVIGLYKMAAALEVVPNRATWQQLGWRGVRLLAQIQQGEIRARATKALLDAAELRGGSLGVGTIRQELVKVSPELATLMARKKRPEVASDMYREELLRLLASRVLHPSALNEDVRRALGVADGK